MIDAPESLTRSSILEQPPEARWRVEKARVVTSHAVAGEYHRLEFKAPEIARWCGPGQFVMLRAAEWGPLLTGRPFDVYRTRPEAGTLELIFKVKGEGTSRLAACAVGDEVEVVGPLGRRVEVTPGGPGLALIARGAGVSPMVRIAQECAALGVSAYAIVSARDESVLLGIDELKEWATELVTVTNEQQARGEVDPGQVVAGWAAEGKVGRLYTCGSRRLGEMVREVSERYSIPGYIFLECRMACGIGVCQGCPAPMRDYDGEVFYPLVCVHGPAFPIEHAIIA